MLAKQEKISKFFLPSDEGNLHPIENKIVSMDPNSNQTESAFYHLLSYLWSSGRDPK
jgi:hypothetical protein